MDLTKQRSQGFATVLAVGTAVPPQKISTDYLVDNYFRVTNKDHLTELKKKFAKICMWPSLIYISFNIIHFLCLFLFNIYFIY
jgi:Chalcone and stilbene synthases, N-terminal domain